MIWLILAALVLVCGAYICAPLMVGSKAIDRSAELRAYGDQIIALDGQDMTPALAARKVQLQRRVLAIADANDMAHGSNGGFKVLIAAIFAGLLVLTAGLYSGLGRADLSRAQPPLAQTETPPTQVELEARMRALLSEDPNNADGQRLYARLLMNMGQFDESLKAYEKAVSLDSSDALRTEYESAVAFVAQTRTAQELSAEDRMGMISGMVDGLAARLEADPDNPQGWVRLLTSRRVLKQDAALAADLQTVNTFYADGPDVLQQILERSAGPK